MSQNDVAPEPGLPEALLPYCGREDGVYAVSLF